MKLQTRVGSARCHSSMILSNKLILILRDYLKCLTFYFSSNASGTMVQVIQIMVDERAFISMVEMNG